MRKRFCSDESGSSASEYALIIALVGLGLGGASMALGVNVSASVGQSSIAVTDGVPSTDTWGGDTSWTVAASGGGTGGAGTDPGTGGGTDPGTGGGTDPGTGGGNGNGNGNGNCKGKKC